MRTRRFTTVCAVLLSLSCWGCSDRPGTPRVGTGSADDSDSGLSHTPPGSDPIRGETPVWPQAEAEIEVPYRGGDVSLDFEVSADLGQLDVHVNVDTTASFNEEIDALQRSLRGEIVSSLAKRVPHVSFGVSRFADFPVSPFGKPGAPPEGDQAYVLLTPVTSDLARVTSAVARLDQPLGFGGDQGEASAEALYQIATGEGFSAGGKRYIATWDRDAAVGGGTFGGVGFRPQALRVVLHVTDAKSHLPDEYEQKSLHGTHDMSSAADALRSIGARTIAIMSTECSDETCRGSAKYTDLRAELSELALRTLAVMEPSSGMCPTGIEGALLPTYQSVCPLVFDVRKNGTGLAETVIDAVLGLLDQLRFGEVHAVVLADPLSFVKSIEAIEVEQRAGVEAPKRVDRLPKGKPDGLDDSFLAVQRRERLGFRVTLRNDAIAAGDAPERFRVSVRVVGDGVALEERTLRVVVPAERGKPPGPPPPDAGRDAAVDAAADASATDASSVDEDAGR